jgi:hypothetical protein
MSPKTAAFLLRLNALGFALFAAVWWLASLEEAAAPARALIDLLKWPLDGDPAALDQIDAWLSAIGAGLLAAFAAITFLVVAPGVEDGDARVRSGAIAAIVTWFVVDSAGSVLTGVASNAVFNAIFLALYLAPLLLLRADAARPARAAA